MLWIMLILIVMVLAIATWGILVYQRDALWYKILRSILGVTLIIMLVGGIFLFLGMIGLTNAETATVQMAAIITAILIVNFFVLFLSGRLLFPKFRIWQQFSISLCIEILLGALIVLSLYR